jgi:hypothetical protein
MPRKHTSVLVAWPDRAAHRRLRAALVLLQVVPESLPWPTLLARVRAAASGAPVAFLEVTDGARVGLPDAGAAPRACDLLALLPDAAQRASVWLSSSAGGVVSEAERAWAREQGFGGWLADTGSAAAGSELEACLRSLAPALGLPGIESGGIARAESLVPLGEGPERWRSHVRAMTGLSAEAWGRELPLTLPLATRRWHLREYPDCVVGHEVVGLWARRHVLARGEAVVLGRAAVALGLMRHVVGEHDFKDEELFYELLNPADDGPALEPVLARLRAPGALAVADRSWRGRAYPACWVGSEAVDAVIASFGGPRARARLALQRLMQLGFIEHVVHEQPLHDGHYFYRFTTTAKGSAPPAVAVNDHH